MIENTEQSMEHTENVNHKGTGNENADQEDMQLYDESKAPRYTVVYTLIRGRQNAKKIPTKNGEKLIYHKKALGYVLTDHWHNDSLKAVTHLEATEEVLLYGATNVMVTAVPTRNNEGQKVPSPYIRATSGSVALQDPELVRDPDKLLPSSPEISVSEMLAKTLANKIKTRRGEVRRTEPKYSNDSLLKAVRARQDELEFKDE